MPRKRPAIARAIATLIATLALVAAAPQPALADGGGIWGDWAEQVTDRSKYEIPLAILVSFPAMIVTTPFWLGKVAFEKLTD